MEHSPSQENEWDKIAGQVLNGPHKGKTKTTHVVSFFHSFYLFRGHINMLPNR